MEGKYEDQEMAVVSNEQKAGRQMHQLRARSARHRAPASFAFLFEVRAGCDKQ